MKLLSHLKAAAALGALAIMMPAPASAEALKPAVGKPLQAAAAALKSRNLGAAQTQVNAARAAATTADEKAKVSQMAAAVFTASGQYAKAAQELEANGAPASQLAPLYYQAGQYDKAIAVAKKAGGPDMGIVVAQSYLKTGKFALAAQTYQGLIKQYGPKEKFLENLAGAQFKAGDKKAYLETTTRLVKVDPSPARWATLLINLKQEQLSRDAKLGLYELMRQTGNVKQPADFQEYAKLAIVANQPGTAKAVLDDAQKAGAIPASDPMTSHLVQAAGARAAEAAANVTKLPATPAGQLQAANTYFGMGKYAEAAAAFAKAPPSDTVKLQQGIAQVKAGQTGPAQATFKAIPDASQVHDVAAMWSLYASTKK